MDQSISVVAFHWRRFPFSYRFANSGCSNLYSQLRTVGNAVDTASRPPIGGELDVSLLCRHVTLLLPDDAPFIGIVLVISCLIGNYMSKYSCLQLAFRGHNAGA